MSKRVFKRNARYPAAHEVGDDGLPACDAVKQIDADPEDWKIVDEEELPAKTHHCGRCGGVVHHPNDGMKIVSDLENTNPEELGLSPMGERR